MFIALLALLLFGSLAGNYFLYKKAILFYTREAEVRLAPVSQRYAEKNKRLLNQAKSRPRIIVFGESRAEMWSRERAENWGEVQIVNRGIGGETVPQIKGRLAQDVLSLSPDLVILQMGDNDLKTIAVLPSRSEQIAEQTYRGIIEIAETIADQGIPVLLTTVFPPAPIELLRKPLWSPEVNDAIDRLNQRLLAYEKPGVRVVDCDAILRDGKHISPKFAKDTLHLNAAGYKALNEGLEEVVRELLRSAELSKSGRSSKSEA